MSWWIVDLSVAAAGDYTRRHVILCASWVCDVYDETPTKTKLAQSSRTPTRTSA